MRFKRGRGNSASRDEIYINLASLIDIIFVLLLFFVVTTTFVRQNQLKIELPEAQTHNQAVVAGSDLLEVSINVDGIYAVNGKVLSHSNELTLTEALKSVSNGNKDMPVLISADANAKYQAVVSAMSAAGRLGFSKLRLVTVEAKAQ